MSGVTRILRVWKEPNGQYQNYNIAVERRDGNGEYVHKMVDDMAGQSAEQLVGQVAFVQELEQISKAGKPYKKVVAVRPAESANVPPQAAPQSNPPQAAPSAPQGDKEEGMFVMGLVGRSMQSGAFTQQEIPSLVGAAMFSWRHREKLYEQMKQRLSGKPSPQQQTPPDYGQELNDDIPF